MAVSRRAIASFCACSRHSTIRKNVSRRSLMTGWREPAPDSAVPERPCTVVLTEDCNLYQTSWHEACSNRLPADYGMSYCHWMLPNTEKPSVDDVLNELKADLVSIQDAVLIARGPLMAWLAQFYLESLPLAGLVMVDPLNLNDQDDISQLELYYQQNGLHSSAPEYQLFQEFVNEQWSHWTLQLEPGPVPMLVICSMVESESFKRGAEKTAQRHSSDSGPSSVYGPVPVIQLDQTLSNHPNDAVDAIANWVDERVC